MCGIMIIRLCQELTFLSLSFSFSIPVHLFIALGHLVYYWNLFSCSRYTRAQPAFHFFPFVFPILCSRLRSTCTTYPHLDEEGHLEYPDIQVSSNTRAFRYRRKLRVTDRHQRGILRGFSQPLFCIVLGVQDRSVPHSLTVHYYDGNYGAIIWINRDAHRNKPQSFLRQHKRLGTIRYEL